MRRFVAYCASSSFFLRSTTVTDAPTMATAAKPNTAELVSPVLGESGLSSGLTVPVIVEPPGAVIAVVPVVPVVPVDGFVTDDVEDVVEPPGAVVPLDDVVAVGPVGSVGIVGDVGPVTVGSVSGSGGMIVGAVGLGYTAKAATVQLSAKRIVKRSA